MVFHEMRLTSVEGMTVDDSRKRRLLENASRAVFGWHLKVTTDLVSWWKHRE